MPPIKEGIPYVLAIFTETNCAHPHAAILLFLDSNGRAYFNFAQRGLYFFELTQLLDC